ncbi:OmpA family protein [Variovorax sp. RHLX14]|uniref:OmpA family protein n=1 Tax=Variovorax sp. RHLX14 TaxID=1259731 RepID=UPI003F47FEF4
MSQLNCTTVFHRREPRLANLALVPVLAVAAYFCSALPAIAQENQQPWTLLDQTAKRPTLGHGYSAIVIMKLPKGEVGENSEEAFAAAAARKETVSVFIDGSYHASFPRPSWAYAEVCPGAHFMDAVRDGGAMAVEEKIPYGQRYELQPSTTLYFQLMDDNSGAPRLKPVDGTAADAALKQIPKAAHTISRLETKGCAVEVNVVTPVKSPQIRPATKYTLQGSMLFGLNKFAFEALQKDGKNELDKIIRASRAENSIIESLSVTGYADPTGSSAHNLSLSKKRAQTVAQYLVKSGIALSTTVATGKGAADLIVADCGLRFKSKSQIDSCNEPNRRVEILVRGQSTN